MVQSSISTDLFSNVWLASPLAIAAAQSSRHEMAALVCYFAFRSCVWLILRICYFGNEIATSQRRSVCVI